jgi:peroxiredoxin Q/BCP
VKKNTAFAKSLKLNYPILSDPSGKVAKSYGIYNAKRGFSGRRTFFIGTNGKIVHIIKKVKTGTHGADIAKQLKKLGVKTKKTKKAK